MNTKYYKRSCDLTSCTSTEGDSSEEQEEEFLSLKTNPLKHKTEMCKNFSEQGRCPYGSKCRFAHGAHELIHVPLRDSFRKRKCNNFLRNGFCPYGLRCQFDHRSDEWERSACLLGLSSMHSLVPRGSKLLCLLGSE
jgi:hypothetical protein